MDARGARRNRWPLLLGVWAAVLAYGWWFTSLEPFSATPRLAPSWVPVVVLIVGATVSPRFRAAAVVWSTLLVLLAWELIALRSLPRCRAAATWIYAHLSRGRFPTLIAMMRVAMRNVVLRGVALAGWAWVGWHFFVRTSR